MLFGRLSMRFGERVLKRFHLHYSRLHLRPGFEQKKSQTWSPDFFSSIPGRRPGRTPDRRPGRDNGIWPLLSPPSERSEWRR